MKKIDKVMQFKKDEMLLTANYQLDWLPGRLIGYLAVWLVTWKTDWLSGSLIG